MNVPPLEAPLRDLRNAADEVWTLLNLPLPTDLQSDAADFLQGPGDRKLLMGYRGFAKTYLAALRTVHKHRLRVDDVGYSDIASLLVSAGKDFADTISAFAMRLITEVPFYQCLAPTADQLTAAAKFDVGPKAIMKDPSFKSTGIFGQIVGSRSHDIVADDIEVPNTAGTTGMREKLWARFQGLTDLLPPEGGSITVLGTPHFEDSMYGRLPDLGYQVRIYPARYPTLERAEILGDSLAPILRERLEADSGLVGTPTDPERYDEERLGKKEAEKGRTHFAMQYQLDTSLSDRDSHPLRMSDLICHDVDPEVGPEKIAWATNPIEDIPLWGLRGDRLNRGILVGNLVPYTGTVMKIDPSGKGKDETAWCISKILNSTIFIADFGGYVDGYTDATLRGLATSAKQWGVNEIEVESNFGDGMFEKLLLPHLTAVGHRCIVTSKRSHGQKESRICDILEPALQAHRIVIDANAMRRDAAPREGMAEEIAMHYRLAYQLSRITRERACLPHDDRIEVLSMAVAHWAAFLARTVDENLMAQYDEEMDEIVRNWETPSSTPNWHSSILPNHLNP